MMKRIGTIFLLCLLATAPSLADCGFVPGKVVKGYAVRCDDPEPYLEAAHQDQPTIGNRDEGIAQKAGFLEGTSPETILVVMVQWELRLKPLVSNRGTEGIQADKTWKQVIEHRRVWRKERPSYCEAMNKPVPVELWVHPPCCDVLPPAGGACLAKLDYGDDVTEEVRSWYADVPSPE
jgi:hypothetical protein